MTWPTQDGVFRLGDVAAQKGGVIRSTLTFHGATKYRVLA